MTQELQGPPTTTARTSSIPQTTPLTSATSVVLLARHSDSARLLLPDLGETAEQGILFGVSSIRYRSRPPIIAFGGPRSDVPLTHGWLLPGFSPPLRHRPSGFLPTVGASLLVDLNTLSGLRVVGLCVGPLWGRWLAAGGDPMPLCPWERRALRGSCLGSCLWEG